jgi:hypothetical protein
MKKQISAPLIVGVIVVVLGLAWFFLSRSGSISDTPVLKGSDIQKPSGMKIDPADIPQGGIAGGGPGGGAPAGGTPGLPPGKGKH